MALEEYKKKRKFDKTSEPSGGKPDEEKLRFVMQKHAASHLHYDFRLELKGVLKSWAVPKGPSLNPEDHRLAVQTEDHPYDYLLFEGIIPKGQYGGGTVIVWDEGTYETVEIDDKDKKAQEHSIMTQFFKGAILFTLHGQKLKGKFALVRDRERDEKTWYLIKVKDKFVSNAEVTKKAKSVISGLSIEEMANKPDVAKWHRNRAKIEQAVDASNGLDRALLQKGIKAPMPTTVKPMNATLIKEIFDDDNWVYELKLDGYRIGALVEDGKVTLQTRGGQNYTKYYRLIVESLSKLTIDCILDGEVVAFDEKGKPNFDELQKYKGGVPLVYYVFDVLWVDGYDVKRLTLLERKELLRQLLPGSEVIKYTDHFDDGPALWEQIQAMNLEGIVCKRKDSMYRENKRTKDWLKLPTKIRQEFVVGGWTESGSGRSFRSLLFGAYENGRLLFVGHSGSGYREKEMSTILNKLKKHEIANKPFFNEVDYETRPHWIEPIIVANFEFATWTSSGKIRKPAVFVGFRDDKDPKEVVREVPLTDRQERDVVKDEPSNAVKPKVVEKQIGQSENKEPIQAAADSNWPELERQEISSQEEFNIEGKNVLLTNIERELWEGVTKAHLIQYYHSVAPYIMPYLKDRAQSLHVKHIKPTAPGLYIKDMEGRQPQWAQIFSTGRKHKKKGKRDVIDYLVCQNEATLLYMVNLGCIDINPWTSRVTNHLYPDFIIIDLDPSDEDFNKVIETAKAAKQYFDANKIKAFPKTSGKTGVHLYLPCEGFTFPKARKIAEHICREVNMLVPEITTTEVTISKRGDKLYIDPNQNDEADTVAAPYCVRPFKRPTVSTPLEWKEVNNKLHSADFDIHNIGTRLAKKGDLFLEVLDNKYALHNTKILNRFL